MLGQDPSQQPRPTDSDTYSRVLLTRGHGYPLWLPEPPTNIGNYKEEGLRIGDVGMVAFDGGFIYFFNIFLPPSHPLNILAPPTLVHLTLSEKDIVKRPNIHPRGCVIASDSVATYASDAHVQQNR